jgi:hypothetical protein
VVDLELANLVLAAALAGLIWTIQLVHYPLFALVGAADWPRYGEEHRRRITWLAAPLMLASVGVAGVLAIDDGSGLSVLNAGLAVGVFVLTGVVFAPLHGRLEHAASERALRVLVRANWVRTIAWTAQVACAVTLTVRG